MGVVKMVKGTKKFSRKNVVKWTGTLYLKRKKHRFRQDTNENCQQCKNRPFAIVDRVINFL